MTEKTVTIFSEQQKYVQEKVKNYKDSSEKNTEDCVKHLLECYNETIKEMNFDSAKENYTNEVILLKFIVTFLAQSKFESSNGTSSKYTYLMPETFLCWALFEYSYYEKQWTSQFVNKIIDEIKNNPKFAFEKCKNRDLIQIHYEAYKHLACNATKDICERLKKILSVHSNLNENKQSTS